MSILSTQLFFKTETLFWDPSFVFRDFEMLWGGSPVLWVFDILDRWG